MFTELIAMILGAERRSTTSNRLENNAAPSVNRTLYQPNSQRSPGNNAQEQKESRCL